MSAGGRGNISSENISESALVKKLQAELNQKKEQLQTVQRRVIDLEEKLEKATDIQNTQDKLAAEWRKADEDISRKLNAIVSSTTSGSESQSTGAAAYDAVDGNTAANPTQQFVQDVVKVVIEQSQQLHQLQLNLQRQQMLTLKLTNRLRNMTGSTDIPDSRSVTSPAEILSNPVACTDDVSNSTSRQRTVMLIGNKEIDIRELQERLRLAREEGL